MCGRQSETFERRSPMNKITRVGVDLAKQVIQVHAVDAVGNRVTSRALVRDKFTAWCAQLAEFGLVFAQKPAVLHQALPHVIEDASNELGTLARLALQRAWAQWQELNAHLAWCDERIGAHLETNEQVRQAERLI